ncbi:raffinose synthase or seed imbibition protein Sip1-domain-containing protein [Dunaliella salina]|uniref:Raffinose synthase or seed imbibition protein Sip1-domain-containing protein n=1 Tax=Dunaliella salina TaxID=3046 RepID=A0ABQ7H8H2_DUNSA|nr:raffinose synthase or seed imbibition protein Sip1-domain-containing protein [Dunaliella salina]|eukprot:KAF5843133.1 raffinose synthase or seed imbibition protein Sip1-domain-containing protein [Dunaliella salina]
MLGFFAEVSDFTRRLTSVRANSKFCSPSAGPDAVMPSRMQDVVAHLRERFGLRYVYCWHGLPAYWAGVMPDAPEVRVGVLSDPAAVYQEMHTYLRDSGVDGVKVDCQAGVGLVGSAMGGGPALSRAFHAALEDSIARNFEDNHAINCMCHSTENMYRMAGTSIARASDDFYPRDYASSHPHVAACAFNTLFMSALVHPDWDMFHSKHPAARLHAMARAVSGAAVYVSDKPGQHDIELLRSLVLADGSILRLIWNLNVGSGPEPSSWQRQPAAARPQPGEEASPLAPALAELEKLGRGACISGVVSGVVGCFHVQGSSWDRNRRKFWTHDPKPKPLTTQVRPCDVDVLQDIPGILPSTSFVAYQYNTSSLSVVPYGGAVEVQLEPNMSDIITFTPMLKVGDLDFAPVGLARMLNSGGALRYVHASPPPTPASSSNATLSSFAAAATATATVSAITPTPSSTLPAEHKRAGPDSTPAAPALTASAPNIAGSSTDADSLSAAEGNGSGEGPSNSIYIAASRLGEGGSPNGVTGLDSLGSRRGDEQGSTGVVDGLDLLECFAWTRTIGPGLGSDSSGSGGGNVDWCTSVATGMDSLRNEGLAWT